MQLRDKTLPSFSIVMFIVLGISVVGLFGTVIAFTGTFALTLAIPFVMFAVGIWFFKLAKGQDSFQHGLHRMLYWSLAINMPTFLAFDRSGLTRSHGLFNAQSLSRIGLFVLVGSLLMVSVLILADRRRWRPVKGAGRTSIPGTVFILPAAMYAWYAIDAPLVSGSVELLLALFRDAEWFLLILLLWVVLRDTITVGRGSARDLLRLALPIIFFPAMVNLVVLPLAPSLIYQTSEATGVSRFGALFTHPNVLGALTAMALFYVWTFWRGWLRVAGVSVMFAMLALSYSRGAIVAFAFASFVYALIITRSATGRILLLLTAISIGLLIAGYGDAIVDLIRAFFERRHGAGKLASLSERTIVWSAASTMIQSEPWLGYGFVSGPKKLADVMASGSTGTYFLAPHAHNELLQAILSGGVLAGAMTLGLYLRAFYLLFRISHFEDRGFVAVLGAWMTVLLFFAVLQPVLSQPVATIGALMLHVYVVLELLNHRYALLSHPKGEGLIPTNSVPVSRGI